LPQVQTWLGKDFESWFQVLILILD
jgi:hypothetical protein